MFGPIVQKFVEDNPQIQLIKVDIDSTPQIAVENNITSIPVLALLNDGDEIYRLQGAKPRAFLDKEILPLI